MISLLVVPALDTLDLITVPFFHHFPLLKLLELLMKMISMPYEKIRMTINQSKQFAYIDSGLQVETEQYFCSD